MKRPKQLYRDHIISPFKVKKSKSLLITLCDMIVTQSLLDETSKKKGRLPLCKKCLFVKRIKF